MFFDMREPHSTEVLDVMNLMGVSLGEFSICVGHRKVIGTIVRLVRWGDDFSSDWTKDGLQCVPRWDGKALVGRDDSCDRTQC